jgi:hypothetical protein
MATLYGLMSIACSPALQMLMRRHASHFGTNLSIWSDYPFGDKDLREWTPDRLVPLLYHIMEQGNAFGHPVYGGVEFPAQPWCYRDRDLVCEALVIDLESVIFDPFCDAVDGLSSFVNESLRIRMREAKASYRTFIGRESAAPFPTWLGTWHKK